MPKTFEFHPNGSVYILENGDFIRVALDADEAAEFVRDWHSNQISRLGRFGWLKQWLSLITLLFERH